MLRVLNFDVMTVIMNFLSDKDILTCRLVCNTFKEVVLSHLIRNPIRLSSKTISKLNYCSLTLETIGSISKICDMESVKIEMFRYICRHVNHTAVDLATHFANKFNIIAEDVCSLNEDQYPAVGNKCVFRVACYTGHLKMAIFLADYFDISITDEEHSGYRWAFYFACENGHVEVVKWLANVLSNPPLTKEFILSESNYSFHWACEGGHLNVIRWLTEDPNGPNITMDELNANVINFDYMFLRACNSGSVDLIIFLVDLFDLTHINFDGNIFYFICLNGHMNVVEHLIDQFNLTKEIFGVGDEEIINTIKSIKHPNIVKLLVDKFHITM